MTAGDSEYPGSGGMEPRRFRVISVSLAGFMWMTDSARDGNRSSSASWRISKVTRGNSEHEVNVDDERRLVNYRYSSFSVVF